MNDEKTRTIKVSQDTWKYLNQKKIDIGLTSANSVIVWLINQKEKFKEKR